MLNHAEFGKRLKYFRKSKDFTQKEIAFRIGVSEQAISKWENGECLPDVYNLKLLGKVLHTSVDTLLDTEGDNPERIVEIIQIGGAVFEIIEKPETILAGKILYAKEYQDIDAFIIVCPALLPPWKRTIISDSSPSISVILPLPSSPQLAPTIAVTIVSSILPPHGMFVNILYLLYQYLFYFYRSII